MTMPTREIVYEGQEDFFDHPHKRAEPRPDDEQMADDAAIRMAEHRAQSAALPHLSPLDPIEGLLVAEEYDPYAARMKREHRVAMQQRLIAQIIDLWPVQRVIKAVALYNRTKARITPYTDLYRSRREAKRTSL